MTLAVHPGETDLWIPLPGDERWDPHTIHTHYFGFSIPEERIGGFVYVRYMPAFPLIHGGVCVFRGTDNPIPSAMEYVDYQVSMPWPAIDGSRITTANGLTIDVVEPGELVRITYAHPGEGVRLELEQRAISPLLARGHVVPGEESHHDDPRRAPGGTEQFMHATGELELRGERFAVDCRAVRDRSWRQVRTEAVDGIPSPAVCWTPMAFGEDVLFNQISIESPDADPAWRGIYDVPEGRPTHHYAWLVLDGEPRAIRRVRREVLERHPQLMSAARQVVEAEDETGVVHRFTGQAIATTAMPAWPNVSFVDNVYRWEDERGRVCHQTCQELWSARYERELRARLRGR